MAVYVNTSGQARTWLHLTDPETGQTLHLDDGEEIDLDLPGDFEDPHLQPAAPVASGAPAQKPAPAVVGPDEAVIPAAASAPTNIEGEE